MRETEIKNFQNLMQQTKEMGILAMRESFAKIVTHLTDTLKGKIDGENKRLHQESIEKVKEFFVNFEKKNIFNDIELGNIVKDALMIVEDIDSAELRKDLDLTKLISNQLDVVKNQIDSCVSSYKRKVTFK